MVVAAFFSSAACSWISAACTRTKYYRRCPLAYSSETCALRTVFGLHTCACTLLSCSRTVGSCRHSTGANVPFFWCRSWHSCAEDERRLADRSRSFSSSWSESSDDESPENSNASPSMSATLVSWYRPAERGSGRNMPLKNDAQPALSGQRRHGRDRPSIGEASLKLLRRR